MGGVVIILATRGRLLRGQAGHDERADRVGAAAAVPLRRAWALVGFLDDYIKIARQRSLGLRSKAKMIGQTVVALVFGGLAVSPWLEDENGITPASKHISFIRDCESFALPTVVVMVLIWLIVTATSNGVNLTDGLDGLAAGASMMVFGAYMLVNIWQNNQSCASSSLDPTTSASATRSATRSTWPSSRPRSPVPASGSCGGTPRRPRSSWATPARCRWAAPLAGLAILTRTELLLVILGGLFVARDASR